MITEQDLVFHLNTESYSYLLRINAYGQPEHLYFGAPADIRDAAALTLHQAPGWGMSVLLKDGDSSSCADDKALEWSGCGRGDYRESPVTLGGSPADLRYTGFRILQGCPEAACSLPSPHGAEETLELTLEQSGLRLKLYYTPYPTALARRCVLENTSDRDIPVTKLMSSMIDLPGSWEMISFQGGWIREMQKNTVPVTSAGIVLDSTTGFSSNRCNPGFLLSEPGCSEEHGMAYGFNLVYSGNHYASVRQSLQGLTRILQGISPHCFEKKLAPGESFETPWAVMAFSDCGLGGLSRQMHRFVCEHIIPPCWNGRRRPVLYNSWEGCGFSFTHRRLTALAGQAKELGCELFVLDDGWFGKRDNDKAGLGDYSINSGKLPKGLDGLADEITAKGMSFGLWFEPECVNPDSDLYRAHPDWALTDGMEPLYGRNQLMLDLTRPEVRDYIVNNVGSILDSAKIAYVKWDMNRHSPALGLRAHEYILGLYEVLYRIFSVRPELLAEGCSSGGGRFDLGMLCWFPQIWCSDDTDPIERLAIQTGLSYLYPQSAFGAHVSASPHAQTLRTTPLTTRANVSFFGCLGYELDLKYLLPVETKQIRAQIEFYKNYRQVFQYGTFRRTERGWQVSDGKVTIAGVFRELVHAAPGYAYLRVYGLDSKKRYRYASEEQILRLAHFGSLVKHVLPVSVDPNGFLMRTADRWFTLPGGSSVGTASGAALERGIPMPPLFRGTGFDRKQHTAGDFSSAIYVIEQIEEE